MQNSTPHRCRSPFQGLGPAPDRRPRFTSRRALLVLALLIPVTVVSVGVTRGAVPGGSEDGRREADSEEGWVKVALGASAMERTHLLLRLLHDHQGIRILQGAVAQDGQLVWSDGIGVADSAGGDSVTGETPLPLAGTWGEPVEVASIVTAADLARLGGALLTDRPSHSEEPPAVAGSGWLGHAFLRREETEGGLTSTLLVYPERRLALALITSDSLAATSGSGLEAMALPFLAAADGRHPIDAGPDLAGRWEIAVQQGERDLAARLQFDCEDDGCIGKLIWGIARPVTWPLAGAVRDDGSIWVLAVTSDHGVIPLRLRMSGTTFRGEIVPMGSSLRGVRVSPGP